jgi:hypothetical protein
MEIGGIWQIFRKYAGCYRRMVAMVPTKEPINFELVIMEKGTSFY